ncbi:MAG: type II toxin-antitoxin system prevent-host-death family antitoxin [Deltaproteobacteria bacterium]|nr:type II toxin-antitoxin system prevent-host-death family antitoxin [Deltaproteobacteria bacterium]
MDTIGAYQAKTHLGQLLERVAKGEHITITKHGVAVATLGPPESSESGGLSGERKTAHTVAEAIQRMKDFRRHHRLGGESIRAMIEEGRR